MMSRTTFAHEGALPFGDVPVSELVPLEYRYALDAAMPILAGRGVPVVRCDVPQLAAEVRQRIPHWNTTTVASAGLWVEPLESAWRANLVSLREGLEPDATLVVVASRPLARMLLQRRDWVGQPLGLRLGGLLRLVRALRRAGFAIEAQYGIHSLASIGFNVWGQLMTRLGRPDVRDRLRAAARLHYCTAGRALSFSTVALLIVRRKSLDRPFYESDYAN